MPPGTIVAVADQGTYRVEGRVERRGVEPVVKVAPFDIGREDYSSRHYSLTQARQMAMCCEIEFDGHEWAQFVQWVGHVNMRLERERQTIAAEQGEAQNVTERPVRISHTADGRPVFDDPETHRALMSGWHRESQA
jgi:hypothetical protein